MKKILLLSVFLACLDGATKDAFSAPCAVLGGIDTSCPPPASPPAAPPATSPTPKPKGKEEYTYDPGNKNGGNASKLPQVQSSITKNPEIVDLTDDGETVHGPEMKFTFTQVAPAR